MKLLECGMRTASHSITHHDGEDDRDGLDRLDDPQHRQTCDLHRREHVHAAQGHRAQEHVVRLVLGRHEDDEDTLDELDADHRADAHEEEDPVEYRHGNHLEIKQDVNNGACE